MHPLQSQLYADHHNLLRLLHCLDMEVACFDASPPREAHLEVILDIFDYVQFYPERYHHPLEDALFELLEQKGIDGREGLAQLRTDHKQLEELTRRASALFDSIAHDNVVRAADLVAVSRAFIRAQVEHIEKENHLLYPLFKQLSEADWEELGARVQGRRDPLFGRGILEEYRHLYGAIMEAEGAAGTFGATARALNHPRY